MDAKRAADGAGVNIFHDMGDSAMHNDAIAAATDARLPSAPPPAPPTGTQSIRRAVAVLREISMYNLKGIRLVDLAANLGLERSTAHRILQCLVYEDMVAEKNPGNRYVLGPLAFELGLAAGKRFNLADLFRPHLRAITEETGDVAFLKSCATGVTSVYLAVPTPVSGLVINAGLVIIR